MAKVYYDGDANPKQLEGKKIAIIGYGSQGHAHALNLHDSGYNVVVAENNPERKEQIKNDGLTVMPAAEAAEWADIVMLLVPDAVQPKVYTESIAPSLKPGNLLMFAHGFNIRFFQIVPPADVDVCMIAPKAPGHRVREVFKDGFGVPALMAVQQDTTGNAKAIALAYARGIGCTKAGVIETTFAEETETDLFGEQAVLCGGVSALIKAGFDTLVKAGYQPEIAYFECLHELKLIVDLIQQGGLSYMRYSVSDTAEHGDYTGGPRVVTEETRAEMRKMLSEIQDGTYARSVILENQAGGPFLHTKRQQEKEELVEQVGHKLREMMPWLDPK